MGIDIGTTGVKVVLMGSDLSIKASAWQPCTLISNRPGWAEEHPHQWWDSACTAIGECLADAGISAAQIEAIGTSGMVPALVLLDAKDNVLRLSMQQNDARASMEIVKLRSALNEKELFERTGSTISQQSIAPKLLWLAGHEPGIWHRTRHIIGSYDYINHKLTGDLAIERNWALESGLYDAGVGDWDDEVLKACGCERDKLPPVVKPTDLVGAVTFEAAGLTGLRAGTPVFGGSADHVAAALAAGLLVKGDVLIKIGGAGDILYCVDRWTTDTRLFIDYHDIPGLYLLNGCMASSGSVLKWFAAMHVKNNGSLAETYAEMDAAARGIIAGSSGLVVLPYFLGEKTPLFDPLARGVIFGLSLSHTEAHIYRAIMEAVAYGFQHHFDILNELELAPERIFISDGGARSDLWRQIVADVIGLDVSYVGNHPGSCAGAAFVAGIACNFYSSWDDLSGLAGITVVNKTNAEAHARYQKLYHIYRCLYQDLRERFRELDALG